MATNYTANYQLNQWESSDQVLRTEFNADNSKIDAALKANADAVTAEAAARAAALGQKADQSALNSLSQTVSALSQTAAGKADQSALNSLSQTVTAPTATPPNTSSLSFINRSSQASSRMPVPWRYLLLSGSPTGRMVIICVLFLSVTYCRLSPKPLF